MMTKEMSSNPRSVSLKVIVILGLVLGTNAEEKPKVQSFLREPSHQTAVVGEHVTLACRVLNKMGELQWTKDDFGLGNDRELVGFKRYRMTGSDEEGDYTLDINPVSLEDDGRFQCQVGAAEAGVLPIRSRYANLTVLVVPDPPNIVQPATETLKTVEGRNVEITCEASGGKPAAEITWFGPENNVISEGITTIHELMSDGKRLRTISTLRFKAEKRHNERSFTCQAQNKAARRPQSTSVKLQVHFQPQVNLRASKNQILEGDSVKFTCDAVGNPSSVQYSWFVDGKPVPESRLPQLELDGVDRRLNGGSVRCQATNSIGRAVAETRMDVSYSPVFMSRPEDTSGLPGELITLRCLVDSNPRPVYSWANARNPRHILSHSPNLTFTLNEDTEGDYICTAKAPGYAKVEAKAKVLIKGRPKIPLEGRVQYAVKGTTGRIICKALSVPEPEVVEWVYKGQILEPGLVGVHKHSVVDNRVFGLLESTLIISDLNDEDFGQYICKVANAFGTDSAAIYLRQQNGMPLVVVVSGILGGVILTVAVIMICVVCRRSWQKDKKETENVGTATMKPSIPTDKMNTMLKQKMSSGDSDKMTSTSTATSAADGVSNDSTELQKMSEEVLRTSSSLSEEHCWDKTSADSGFAGQQRLHGQTNRNVNSDYVDGLTRPYDHHNYGYSSYYATNLMIQPSSVSVYPPATSVKSLESLLSTSGRHNYSSSNNNNNTSDYVPASALLAMSGTNSNYDDNYAVYVNGSSNTNIQDHEVIVPAHVVQQHHHNHVGHHRLLPQHHHVGSTSSSPGNSGSSLATHV